MHYDVIIVGGGPGGYVAAIQAAQLGAKVLLVEQDKLGGVCLNRGCIPTKTLLYSSEKWMDLKKCTEFGLHAENIGFNYKAVFERKEQVVAKLREGIIQLVKSNDIIIACGKAELLGGKRVRVANAKGCTEYAATKIILATGSVPGMPPLLANAPSGVITSDDLLASDDLPDSIAIVGAGAVGVEFGTICQSFGCDVTIIEMLPAILPNVDTDIVKRAGLSLRKQGIKLLTSTKVNAIQQVQQQLVLQLEMGNQAKEISVEKVLVATGRIPNIYELGLHAAGVACSSKGVVVDEYMETSVPGIYAIGDLTGRYMWAHAASAEGIVAAENACGQKVQMDYRAVPGCIFTTPEIAMVGLTEQQALLHGKHIVVSKFNFAANGKAVSMGQTEGMVKIIADADTDGILGMHVYGPYASALIMEGTIAIRNNLSAKDLAATIHPHPSLSETVMECAAGISGTIIHQLKLKVL